MSEFSERIRRNEQVMIASLISQKVKAELDKVAKATKRSKSGCVELALKSWLHDELIRIKKSVAETVV